MHVHGNSDGIVLFVSKKKNHQELKNEDPLMHPIFFWSGISDWFENKNYVKTKSGILKKGILTS